jgi:nitroreductase
LHALIIESIKDGLRRSRHFGQFRAPANLTQAKVDLQKDLHLIERALALPEPRRPFGLRPVARINEIIEHYGASLGEYLLNQAQVVLAERDNWNERGVRPKPSKMRELTEAQNLLASRHSVRAFGTNRAPTDQELSEIMELAGNAPSVSNTQSWSVRAYRSETDIQQLLALQNGNAGNSRIPLLLIVTVDIRAFAGPGERNQMWIDGGIFLQQLLLSIHASGWASCPMNFSETNAQANRLRKLSGIADHEEIICYVSVGEQNTSIPPARSVRKPVNQLLRNERLG